MESHGIDLIAAPTEKAVKAYNELSATMKIAAGFHSTWSSETGGSEYNEEYKEEGEGTYVRTA